MLPPNPVRILCLRIRRFFIPLVTFLKRVRLFRVFKWIKKHQKLTVYIGTAFVSYQLFMVRAEYNRTLADNKSLEVSNEVLRRDMLLRNASMDNLDLAWYRKVKRGRNFYITGMNQTYEDIFGLNKLQSLGKTNFDLVPYEAAKFFNDVDSVVAHTGIVKDTIEPWILKDSSKIRVYTRKWRKIEFRDTLVYGVSMPLARFIAMIDDHGNLEVIEIIPSKNNNNAVQDTIIKKD